MQADTAALALLLTAASLLASIAYMVGGLRNKVDTMEGKLDDVYSHIFPSRTTRKGKR